MTADTSNLHKRGSLWRSLALLTLGFSATLLVPAQALGRALIRFIHAVPGVGTATADVNAGAGPQTVGSVGFGQATPWRSIRSGTFSWSLLGGGGKTLVKGSATVDDGAYDLVVLDKLSRVTIGVYRAEGGKPGTSLVRVIHAAPELGSPALTLDGRPAVKSLSYTAATPYLSVTPGVHTFAAMRPGDHTPLVSTGRVHLLPDTAYSAIVIGSRGQRVRVIEVVDRGAPLTRSAPAAASSSSASSIVVRPGDSLWSIARHLLPAGASDAQVQRKLVEIWKRNAGRIGTGDPNLIFAGQRLLI